MQPAPEEEDLTKEGEGDEQRWLLHVLYTVLSLRNVASLFVFWTAGTAPRPFLVIVFT